MYRYFYFNRFCISTKLTLMQRFECKSVFVLQLPTFKVGFSGPKTFRGFRETAPGSECMGVFLVVMFKMLY